MKALPLFSRLAIALIPLLPLSPEAAAGFESSISFTPEEQALHLATLPRILEEASSCLKADLARHEEFYAQWGISPFYGDRSWFSKLSTEGKKQHLRDLGKPEELLAEMQPTSCVGLTLKCLGQGFEAAGQPELWQRLKDFTRANAQDGTALQHGLRELGWKVLFWNPDLSRNAAWDAEEKQRDPSNQQRFWGYHAYRWKTVTGPERRYYFNAVDDFETLVNFGERTPEALLPIPFFVGTAHTGYHVFPGTNGRVIEGHSTRSITDPRTLESADFNPLGVDGAPRGSYRSGLIAIPPGY